MNYIGDHPLNLIGKIAIVTSASSPTGAAISRALLNSNALVLGIDSQPPHSSTQSARGSHFQFYQYAYNDSKCVSFKGEIVKEAERVFGRVGVDFLVVVREGGGEGKGAGVLREVLDGMAGRGEGRVVTVYAGVDEKEQGDLIEETKAVYKELEPKGVVCNAVVHRDVSRGGGAGNTLGLAPSVRALLQDHVNAHKVRREKGGYEVEKERDIANVVLFLCTNLGKDVQGALLGSESSCTAL